MSWAGGMPSEGPEVRAINAVLCDLDGTLVRAGNTVLAEDVEMLRAVRDNDVRTTLVTGRPSRCLSDMPAELRPLFTAVFTSNGAASYTGGRVEIIAPLETSQSLTFAKLLRQADPTVAFAVEFETTFGYEPGYAWWPATDTDPGAVRAGIESLLNDSRPITKLLCRSGRLSAAELARTAEALDDAISVTYSCPPSENGPVEVMSSYASKGQAALRDLGCARIDPRSAVAFGDRHNDLAMLVAVGRGVVIGEVVEPGLVGFVSAKSVGHWLAENQDSWTRKVNREK